MTPSALSEAPTIAADAAATPPPAQTNAYGHYVVEQRPDGSPWMLGQGGMGITFKATDTNLHCPVALKIISPRCFGGESSRRRFLREARVAAQIRHPNVAAVYHLDSEEGEFFYAMEFVDGVTTEAWVQRRGPMTVGLALDVVMQVTRALTAADQLKVIHRDIKPGNIMILPDPADGSRVIVKVIDFGLAQSLMPEASPTATTLAFLGTPQFASPEQAETGQGDIRSDIYSLGSTLWYYLTGEAPFSGTPGRIIAQLLTNEPPWERLDGFPKEIRNLLRSMLARNPAKRPQTPVALHMAICECRESLGRETLAKRAPKVKPEMAKRFDRRSFAVAGALGILLVGLTVVPRRGAEIQPGAPIGAVVAYRDLSPPRAAPSAELTGAPAKVRPQGPTNLLAADLPEAAGNDEKHLPTTIPNIPATSLSLEESEPDAVPGVSLEKPMRMSLAREDASEMGAASPEVGGVATTADHRHANKPRHRSSEQPFDRLSRNVSSLWRRLF